MDDPRYAQYKVKILIVGIPSDIREYFNNTPNRASVANRLCEIPEVARLDSGQCDRLIERGFRELLKYECLPTTLEKIKSHVAWVTDRIPQRIHEYCLELAILCERGSTIGSEHLEAADKAWLNSSLSHAYGVVELAMNQRDTRVGRRNQAIYAIGTLPKNEFKLSEVEVVVRRDFPNSTSNRKLNVSGVLTDLANGSTPIIKKSPKGDGYVFTDPRYKMCIRTMFKIENENITNIDMSSLGQ